MRITIDFDPEELHFLNERIAEKVAQALSGRSAPVPEPEAGWEWWTDTANARERAERVTLLREMWDRYPPISRRAFRVLIANPWPTTFLGEELIAAMGITLPANKNPRNVAAGYFAVPGRLRTAQGLPIAWCVGEPNWKGAVEYWASRELAAQWIEAIGDFD
jgi:hypothetical protein